MICVLLSPWGGAAGCQRRPKVDPLATGGFHARGSVLGAVDTEMRGAGDGNRTRMTSLEGWGSTIELHPRNWRGSPTDGDRRARSPGSSVARDEFRPGTW